MLLLVAVAAAVLVGCKKEDAKCDSNLSDLTLKDNAPVESIGVSNNQNKIPTITSLPYCITVMSNDPEFDFYDFDRIYHDYSLDTAGFQTYVIPSKFVDTELLCVAVSNNSIALRFAFSLPLGFDYDYEYYYNEGIDVGIDAFSYNYEDLYFSGRLNVRNHSLVFTYVNEEIYSNYGNGDLPPLWDWNHMNLCEKICTGVETMWYVGFTLTGGWAGIIMGEINSAFFAFARNKACL